MKVYFEVVARADNSIKTFKSPSYVIAEGAYDKMNREGLNPQMTEHAIVRKGLKRKHMTQIIKEHRPIGF